MLVGSHLYEQIFLNSTRIAKDTLPGFKNFPAQEGTAKKYESSRNATQSHLTLVADIDFENSSFQGTAYLVLDSKQNECRNVTFDAKELKLGKVEAVKIPTNADLKELEKLKFQDLEATYSDDVVTAHLPFVAAFGEKICLKIPFEANNPKAGIYFVHKNKHSDADYDSVWTQGQDVDSPYWFPCQDDPRLKFTTLCRFTFPKHWHGVGNGVLLEEKIVGQKKVQTWHLDQPHSPYLLAFAAGDMELHGTTWRNKTVDVLLPKKFAHLKDEILSETTSMLEFYSNYWGFEFPWPKYSQAFVADFLYGGMENTTLTINTDNCLGPDDFMKSSRRMNYLVMHEMAHQWFGDAVTCETWAEGWLNEGFATHSETLWDEHKYGKDSGIFYMLANDKGWYLEEASAYQRPVVTNNYEFVSEIFDGHLYSKGALVLNHLRDLIGEEKFRHSVKRYLNSNVFKPVRTPDLIRAIEEETGWNPRKFFDTYIYRAGHIELEVSSKISSFTSPTLELEVEQKQKISTDFPVFEFENFVFLQYKNGENEEIRVSCDKAKQTVYIPLKSELLFAVFDPRGTVVGDAKQKFAETMAQSILAPETKGSAYHKFLAAKSLLAHNATPANLALVRNWLANEPCIRARAVAYEMVAASDAIGVDALLLSLDEKDPFARVSYVDALGKAGSPENTDMAERLKKIANDDSEVLLAREKALTGITSLAQRTPTLRTEKERKELLKFGKSFLKQKSYMGMLEGAALTLVTELSDASELSTFAGLLERHDVPWRIQVVAVNSLAKYSARYPELRAEIRPHLLRFAAKFFPVRVASQLPSAWAESKDPIYASAFESFINRKNYGLLSMLIPRARRSFEKFNKNLSSNAAAEKFSELSELKTKFARMEKELESLKELLTKKT